jgi:hypothetical protein
MRGSHAVIMPYCQGKRNTVQTYLAGANCVPNTIGPPPPFFIKGFAIIEADLMSLPWVKDSFMRGQPIRFFRVEVAKC